MEQRINEGLDTKDGVQLKGNINGVIACHIILKHMDPVVQVMRNLLLFRVILEVPVHFVNTTLDCCGFMSYILVNLPNCVVEIEVFDHILHIMIHF